MDYIKNQEKMDCMAGTAILENLKQTANLNITEYYTTVNRRCLCLVQPKVVEQNNDNTKHRLMKATKTNYCHNSSCKLNRVLTNNYNIKLQQQRQKCPLTPGLLIVILLAIILTQMPTMVRGKAISRDVLLKEILAVDAAPSSSSSQTSADSKVLLLSSEEEMDKIRQKVDTSSLDEANSSNSLTSLEVLRHVQRTQQHQQERRTRHRKRHINDLVIKNFLHENSNSLEWSNTCNGVYQITNYEGVQIPLKEYIKKFHTIIENELLSELPTHGINIADISVWSSHEGRYAFLPKLNRNGKITLRHWHRNMQIYVASFGYLARTQYKFDKRKQINAGNSSEELNKLLKSARHLLCELETTINGSHAINNTKKLKTISREVMNKKLNHFQTKRDELRWGLVEANTVDLKFAKNLYLKFVTDMHTILKRKIRKHVSTNTNDENQSYISHSFMIDDDSVSIDRNSLMKTDSRLSVGDSFEEHMKSHRKH